MFHFCLNVYGKIVYRTRREKFIEKLRFILNLRKCSLDFGSSNMIIQDGFSKALGKKMVFLKSMGILI